MDVMCTFNTRNVVDLLCKDYEDVHSPKTTVTADEIRMKDLLKDILETYAKNPSTYIEQEFGLEFQRNHDCREESSDSEDSNNESVTSECDEESNVSAFDKGITRPYKEKAVMFFQHPIKTGKSGKKKRSFTSVQSKFKKLQSIHQLRRWEKSVAQGGTRDEKWNEIGEKVLKKIEEIKGRCAIIHDEDLRRWAMEAAKDLNFDFKASKSWCLKFKRRHHIVSRKVTKVVTKTQIANQEEIAHKAENFVMDVKKEMETIGSKNILNSDQSGFQKECHSGRSLDIKGIKSVGKIVQSVNSTTHSFTIQPTINAEGEFVGPLLIVMSEPNGAFGPNVSKTLFKPPNVKIVATKSGKCTKEVLQNWYTTVVRPHIQDPSVLLLDAFGGFNSAADSDSQENVPIDIMRIPEHSTGMIQPLDVMGFRPWKQMYRRIQDLILLHGVDFPLHVRNNIICLQSLLYSTISSPRFREMFKMGWFKAGYLTVHPAKYETPVQYCSPMIIATCSIEECEAAFFIKCSWCTEVFCFAHFFMDFHLCDNFVEDSEEH